MNRTPSKRFLIIGLLYLGIITSYFDRSALSYAIIPLQKSFNLDNRIFGYLSAIFFVGYLFSVLSTGILIDKFGAKRVWGISAILWSLITISIGFSSSITQLFILRFLLGVTEGSTFPAVIRVITDWIPISERSRALAFTLISVPLASVIGAPISTFLITIANWKVMFFCLGAMGILWVIIWFMFFEDNPKNAKFLSKTEYEFIIFKKENQNIKNLHDKDSSTIVKNIFIILKNPVLAINNFTFFAFSYLLFFGITWLPGYFQQSLGLNLAKTGIYSTIPWLIAALFMLFNGWFSDYIWLKTKSLYLSRSLIISCSLLLSALFFLITIKSHNIHYIILFLSIAIGFGMMPDGGIDSLNADIKPELAATSLGVMLFIGAIAGILAPIITGIITQKTHNYLFVFLIMVVLNVIASLLVLLFQRPDKYQPNDI